MYSPESSVRKTGSYIYEEFMPTDGTDVKVRKSLEWCLPLSGLGELKVQLFCLVLHRLWKVCLGFEALTAQFHPQSGERVLCGSHQEDCVRPSHLLFCVCSRNTFWKLQLVLVLRQVSSLSFQVYTVGPDYAHAEARKSPALDGKVERDSEGKEIRYPVMLTAMEKLVARKVCVAFKVCISFPVRAGLHKCLICVRAGIKICHPGMSQA